MERFFNFNQFSNQDNIVKKRKPAIRISVQIDEAHLENNVISFKDLFQTSTYIHKKNVHSNKNSKQIEGSSVPSEIEDNLDNSFSINNSKSFILSPSCSENELEKNKIQTSDNLIKELNRNVLTPNESEYDLNDNLNSYVLETNYEETDCEIISITKCNDNNTNIDNEKIIDKETIKNGKGKKKDTDNLYEENIEELEQTEYEELEQQENDNEYINEIENIIINDKQPLDIKKALQIRDMIEKEKYKELKKQMFQQKKRKFYETYDKNDPFIDDSEDYIMNNSFKIQKIEKQNFVVWSGAYGKNKRKRNNKTKQLKIDVAIKIPKKEDKIIEYIPSTLYPLDPKLKVLMKQLKSQSLKCKWSSHDSIPEVLLPILRKILKLADKYNEINMNFYGHLRLILQHKFSKDISYLKSIVEKLLLDEKILYLTNEQSFHLKTIKNVTDRYKLDNNYSSDLYNSKRKNNEDNSFSNNDMNNKKQKTSTNGLNKFSWNASSRLALYNIIRLEIEKDMLSSKEQVLEPKTQNNRNKVIIKQTCKNLISLWPDSTMKITTLMREYNYVKKKKEKSIIRIHKDNTKKSKISSDNNHYIIKILYKSEQQNENLILPKFVKSTSIFYPNHNKHYQRSVRILNKDESDTDNNMSHENLIPVNSFNKLIEHDKLSSYILKNKSNNHCCEETDKENLNSNIDKKEIKSRYFNNNISKTNEIEIIGDNNEIVQNKNSNNNSKKYGYGCSNSTLDFDPNQDIEIIQELGISQELEISEESFMDQQENQNSNILKILEIEINQLMGIIKFLQKNTDLDDSDSRLIFLFYIKDYFDKVQNKILNNTNNKPLLIDLQDLIYSINPKKIPKSTNLKKSTLKPNNLSSNIIEIPTTTTITTPTITTPPPTTTPTTTPTIPTTIPTTTSTTLSSLKSEVTLKNKSVLNNTKNTNIHSNNNQETLNKPSQTNENPSTNSIQQIVNMSPSKNISLKRKLSTHIDSPLKKIVKLSNNYESKTGGFTKTISKQENVMNSKKTYVIISDNTPNENKVDRADSLKINNINKLNKINSKDNYTKVNNVIPKTVSSTTPILNNDNNLRKAKSKPRAFSRRKTTSNKILNTNVIISAASSNNNKTKPIPKSPLPKSNDIPSNNNNNTLHKSKSTSILTNTSSSSSSSNGIKTYKSNETPSITITNTPSSTSSSNKFKTLKPNESPTIISTPPPSSNRVKTYKSNETSSITITNTSSSTSSLNKFNTHKSNEITNIPSSTSSSNKFNAHKSNETPTIISTSPSSSNRIKTYKSNETPTIISTPPSSNKVKIRKSNETPTIVSTPPSSLNRVKTHKSNEVPSIAITSAPSSTSSSNKFNTHKSNETLTIISTSPSSSRKIRTYKSNETANKTITNTSTSSLNKVKSYKAVETPTIINTSSFSSPSSSSSNKVKIRKSNEIPTIISTSPSSNKVKIRKSNETPTIISTSPSSNRVKIHKSNEDPIIISTSPSSNKVKTCKSNKASNKACIPQPSSSSLQCDRLDEISNIINIPPTSISHKINSCKLNKTSNINEKSLSSISKLINTFKPKGTSPHHNTESPKTNKNDINLTSEPISNKIEPSKKMHKHDLPSKLNRVSSPPKNIYNKTSNTSENGQNKNHEPVRLDVLKNMYESLINRNKENINSNETSTHEESKENDSKQQDTLDLRILNSQENSSLSNERTKPIYRQYKNHQSVTNNDILFQNNDQPMNNTSTKNLSSYKSKNSSRVRLSLHRKK